MIQFSITDSLRQALEIAGIAPSEYRPAYGGESVGLDLYNAGPDLQVYPVYYIKQGRLDIELDNFETAFMSIIPTGVKVALPPNHTALVLQRGSVRKTPLIHRAGVVDPGYTDEIFVPVLNFSNQPYVIKQGQKLPFQIVCMPVISQFCFIEPDVYNTTTRHALRKDACFGSSDVLSTKSGDESKPSIKGVTAYGQLPVMLPPTEGYLQSPWSALRRRPF